MLEVIIINTYTYNHAEKPFFQNFFGILKVIYQTRRGMSFSFFLNCFFRVINNSGNVQRIRIAFFGKLIKKNNYTSLILI